MTDLVSDDELERNRDIFGDVAELKGVELIEMEAGGSAERE